MKRYDIKQVETGQISHSYIADAPMDPQSAWGTLAWTEQVPVLSDDGSPVLDDSGAPTFQALAHPATYTVVVTDLAGTRADPPWIAMRETRDALLTASDWTQMPDNQLEAALHAAWEIYRQALRALPEVTSDPVNPAWPVPPGSA